MTSVMRQITATEAAGRFRFFMVEVQAPETPLTLRCARCPRWSAKTTMRLKQKRWESHLRRRHSGHE